MASWFFRGQIRVLLLFRTSQMLSGKCYRSSIRGTVVLLYIYPQILIWSPPRKNVGCVPRHPEARFTKVLLSCENLSMVANLEISGNRRNWYSKHYPPDCCDKTFTKHGLLSSIAGSPRWGSVILVLRVFDLQKPPSWDEPLRIFEWRDERATPLRKWARRVVLFVYSLRWYPPVVWAAFSNAPVVFGGPNLCIFLWSLKCSSTQCW